MPSRWQARFEYDRSKLDGMPRKLMDVSRLNALGWSVRVPLKDGFRKTYERYVAHAA